MFRNLKHLGRWLAIAVAIGLLWPSQATAAPPSKPGGGDKAYTLVPLPDAQNNTPLDGVANAMHEVLIDGQLAAVEVVGSLSGHAYHWWLDSGGRVVMTTPLPPTNQLTAAHDINDGGIVVGGAQIGGAMLPAAWFSLEGSPIPLPVPEGVTGIAVNVNNHGMVVGWLRDAASSTEMAVVWQITSGAPDPAFLGPVKLSEATDVWEPDLNDAGLVVTVVKIGESYRGQRWSVTSDGVQLTASPPETLTGIMMDENGYPRTVQLRSMAINETGDICGHYAAAGGPWGAFLLLIDGTLIDLPPLSSKRYNSRSNAAYDLTDAIDPASIQIVGDGSYFDKRSGLLVDSFRALWQGEKVRDLEAETDSSLRLAGIDRISNHGWLAGYAGQVTTPRAVVLVPR